MPNQPTPVILSESEVAEIEKRRAALSQIVYTGCINPADYEFTVNAPADIDALCATVRAAWAESERLRSLSADQTTIETALRDQLAQAHKDTYHAPSPEQLRQVADAIVDMLINHEFDDGDGLRGIDPRGLETTPDLIATILINFHNHHQSQVGKRTMTTMNSNERDPYCESCHKTHPAPRDAAHREELQCEGVWYFADAINPFREQVEAVVTPVMKELETALLSKIDTALDKALNSGATRMRERCVERLQELRVEYERESASIQPLPANPYGAAARALHRASRELESLTLDREKEQ